MPAGYDAEVAELFRDLRAAIALSEMDLAARIGTRPEVVQALEQGALYALPPWAETCRVVNAYGTLLNLDVRPLLRRIYAQLEAGIVELQPKPFPDVPMMTPSDSGDFGFAPERLRRSQPSRYSVAARSAVTAAKAVAECGAGVPLSGPEAEPGPAPSAAKGAAADPRRAISAASLARGAAPAPGRPPQHCRAPVSAAADPFRPARTATARPPGQDASAPAATGCPTLGRALRVGVARSDFRRGHRTASA